MKFFSDLMAVEGQYLFALKIYNVCIQAPLRFTTLGIDIHDGGCIAIQNDAKDRCFQDQIGVAMVVHQFRGFLAHPNAGLALGVRWTEMRGLPSLSFVCRI